MAFAGWVSSQDLPGYFAAADVAIYPLDDTLLNRAKCPVKLTDLLLAGLGIWLTYRLGKKVFSAWIGVLAAFLTR